GARCVAPDGRWSRAAARAADSGPAHGAVVLLSGADGEPGWLCGAGSGGMAVTVPYGIPGDTYAHLHLAAPLHPAGHHGRQERPGPTRRGQGSVPACRCGDESLLSHDGPVRRPRDPRGARRRDGRADGAGDRRSRQRAVGNAPSVLGGRLPQDRCVAAVETVARRGPCCLLLPRCLLLMYGWLEHPSLRPASRAADARGADADRVPGATHARRGGRGPGDPAGHHTRHRELGVRLRCPQRAPCRDPGHPTRTPPGAAVDRVRRPGRRRHSAGAELLHRIPPVVPADGTVQGWQAGLHARAEEHRGSAGAGHRCGSDGCVRPLLPLARKVVEVGGGLGGWWRPAPPPPPTSTTSRTSTTCFWLRSPALVAPAHPQPCPPRTRANPAAPWARRRPCGGATPSSLPSPASTGARVYAAPCSPTTGRWAGRRTAAARSRCATGTRVGSCPPVCTFPPWTAGLPPDSP